MEVVSRLSLKERCDALDPLTAFEKAGGVNLVNPNKDCTLTYCEELLFRDEEPQKVIIESAPAILVSGSLTVSF